MDFTFLPVLLFAPSTGRILFLRGNWKTLALKRGTIVNNAHWRLFTIVPQDKVEIFVLLCPLFYYSPPVRGNSKNRSSKLLICSPPIGAPVSPGPVLASLGKRLLNIFFLLYKELILAFETMFHYPPSSEESSHDLGV